MSCYWDVLLYTKEEGPLYVGLDVASDGYVKLNMFVKYCDRWCHHNNYINVTKVDAVNEAFSRLDQGCCPYCPGRLYFEPEDKYTHTRCIKCDYSAWSDKIYDECDFYDDYD